MSIRRDEGFTLVEVLVATGIFAIAVFAITGFYLTAASHGLIGRSETAGALLAEQRIEFLRSKSYGSLAGFAATETVDELGTPTPGGRYTRVTAVTTPYLGTSRLTKLDVTVSWVDQDQARTITLTTVVVDF